MATKYNLTTAFTAITETSGTIQNVGNESVELASSTNAVEGEGIVLNPGEKRSFKGAMSARSIGDAGADVNVVDFTEAGEGGEEYVLPVASDTELGGIKISNSFTVASDGTLNIKKSGKTILGAVKSSDDEGKVTVNNDGTMTYNPLGYRQPSTAYRAGQIAYHSALPTGWYLECTTAGTTGSGALTISSPSIGGTVSDGTVVWTVRQTASTKNLAGFLTGNLKTGTNQIFSNDDKYIVMMGGDDIKDSPFIFLNGNNGDGSVVKGRVSIGAHDLTVGTQLILNPNGALMLNNSAGNSYDLAGSAIVAKSLGKNGYIKYASGLIMQWGELIVTAGGSSTGNFPIAYTIEPLTLVATSKFEEDSTVKCCRLDSKSQFTIWISGGNGTEAVFWMSIGH